MGIVLQYIHRQLNKGAKMITEATKFDQRHGSPYDRGCADSYYGRDYSPHYFTGDTYNSPRVDLPQMTAFEIVAYTAGYRDNESSGDKKEW
jgi:hypothetical protein